MLHARDLAEAGGIAAAISTGVLGVGRMSSAATNRDRDGVELKDLAASPKNINYNEAGK